MNAKELGNCRGLNGLIMMIIGLFMSLVALLMRIGDSGYPDDVYDVLLKHGYIWTDDIYMIFLLLSGLVISIGFL